MGVIDVKNARYSGCSPRARLRARARLRGDAVRRAQPLGRLIELNSTHPLTGRRIAHLGDIAKGRASFPRLRLQGRRAAGASRQGRSGASSGRAASCSSAARRRAGRGASGRLAAGAGGHRPRRALHAAAALSVRHPTADDRLALMTDPAASPVIGRPAQLTARRSAAPIPASSPARMSSTRTNRADDRRLPLDARLHRRSIRRLEARAQASRPAAR